MPPILDRCQKRGYSDGMSSISTPSPRPAVIFDIDRTLADIEYLSHLFTPEQEAGFYRAFHEAAVHAPTIGWVEDEVYRARHMELAPIAVSARPQMHLDVTLAWLERVGLDMDAVYLRPDHWLHLSDVDAKRAMLPVICEHFTPVAAFEDKPEIAAMWEAHGIPTTLVAPVTA